MYTTNSSTKQNMNAMGRAIGKSHWEYRVGARGKESSSFGMTCKEESPEIKLEKWLRMPTKIIWTFYQKY